MTDLISPAETRVINPETEQTAVIRHRRALPPTQPLRRSDAHPDLAHDTGEVPLLGPTGAELTVAARAGAFQPPVGTPPDRPLPSPPPGPPVPPPGWAAPAAVYPLVFPAPLERVADETEVVSLLGALGGVEAPRARRSQPYRRPKGWVRTRRHSRPTPVWAWALVNAAISVTFGAVGGGIVLALAVLEVAR